MRVVGVVFCSLRTMFCSGTGGNIYIYEPFLVPVVSNAHTNKQNVCARVPQLSVVYNALKTDAILIL